MTKQILEAFAKDIREGYAFLVNKDYPRGEVFEECRKREISLVCRIATQFNPRFDESRFRRACQPNNETK